MAADPMVEVGYEGSQYSVPKSVLQSGMAAAYIRDMLAERAERKAQREAKVQQSVETEFSTIKTKLSKLELLSERIDQLESSNTAYRAANDALRAQIDSLEDSNDGLGSTSGKARQASLELSQTTAGAALMAETLMRHRESLELQVQRMQDRLDLLEGQQQKQLADASNAALTRQRMAQEEVNALKDTVAQLEARAVKAEAVAARALRDAEASKNLGRNDITRDDLIALINAELIASTPQTVEMAVSEIRDQFPQGIHGQRMSGEYMDQTTTDGVNAAEIRYGTD